MELKGYYYSVGNPTFSQALGFDRNNIPHAHYEKASWAKPVIVKGYTHTDLFVSHARFGEGRYAIFEGKSGKSIGNSANTVKEAIANAKTTLDANFNGNEDEFERVIDLNVKYNGNISPRYN
jgi:hypothetical protein